MNFLKQYGQLKSENLRRLCYNEEGFRNIERGIRVAEFTSLDRDLPRKMVTQGLEIFFKYTGVVRKMGILEQKKSASEVLILKIIQIPRIALKKLM